MQSKESIFINLGDSRIGCGPSGITTPVGACRPGAFWNEALMAGPCFPPYLFSVASLKHVYIEGKI